MSIEGSTLALTLIVQRMLTLYLGDEEAKERFVKTISEDIDCVNLLSGTKEKGAELRKEAKEAAEFLIKGVSPNPLLNDDLED